MAHSNRPTVKPSPRPRLLRESPVNLDPLEILMALGVRAPSAVTPVAGGWDTQIFSVVDGQKTYALRIFRPDQLSTSRREAAVMRTLYETGLPVPRVHAAGISDGRPALLMSWCPGRTLLAEV